MPGNAVLAACMGSRPLSRANVCPSSWYMIPSGISIAAKPPRAISADRLRRRTSASLKAASFSFILSKEVLEQHRNSTQSNRSPSLCPRNSAPPLYVIESAAWAPRCTGRECMLCCYRVHLASLNGPLTMVFDLGCIATSYRHEIAALGGMA